MRRCLWFLLAVFYIVQWREFVVGFRFAEDDGDAAYWHRGVVEEDKEQRFGTRIAAKRFIRKNAGERKMWNWKLLEVNEVQ